MKGCFDLLLITPDREPAEVLYRAAAALDAASASPGRIAVQLRSKQLAPAARAWLGQGLRVLCRLRGAPLFVNGDLELASALEAEGVQLPEAGPSLAQARALLGPRVWLGASRHDEGGVRAAAADGAQLVLVSPVFTVPGKGPALGLAGLRALAAAARDVPAVALGGIDATNAGEAMAAGARAVAVIREVFDAPDPAAAVDALLAAVERAR